MGVLNIQEHLRHRRRREIEENISGDNVWEEELFELTQHQVPQEESTRRSRSRNRPQKSKPQYYKISGRKIKTGSRQMRRHENTCFLLSLVDQEELGELDVSDFLNSNVSAFASLFISKEKMKIWNEFIDLPEEDQAAILRQETNTAVRGKQNNRGIIDDVQEPTTERDAVATAEKSYNRIERRIRATLTKKRFPLDGLKHYEDEVVFCFSEDPLAIMISVPPSSFDRLLVHGVCQFLNLTSTSMDCNGVHMMEIENKHETFCAPSLLLCQYLKRYR